MTVDISFVIVNWNAKGFLRDCLTSIAEETHFSHEIIVVDNASTDGSAAMVRNEFSDVILIANDKNPGFGAANNQGIKAASGRYVLLLNPDTLIIDGAVDKMLDWAQKQNDLGCAGCQVLESEKLIQRTCFSDPSLLNLLLIETGLYRAFPRSSWFGQPYYSHWDRRTEREVDVVSGMFMLIPRNVFDSVGFMDEAFFVYAEEADLCRRIRRSGLRCVFTPAAQIIHRDGGGRSTTQVKPRMYVQLQKSLIIYMHKYYGHWVATGARTIFIFSNSIRLILFMILYILRPRSTARARARLSLASLLFLSLGVEPKP